MDSKVYLEWRPKLNKWDLSLRKLFVVIAGVSIFALGVVAAGISAQSASTWTKLSVERQTGYAEGFGDGLWDGYMEMAAKEECSSPKVAPRVSQSYDCVRYRLIYQVSTVVLNNPAALDQGAALASVKALYAQSQNQLISWNDALIIARAMVTGVSVTKADLEAIRQNDIKVNGLALQLQRTTK